MAVAAAGRREECRLVEFVFESFSEGDRVLVGLHEISDQLLFRDLAVSERKGMYFMLLYLKHIDSIFYSTVFQGPKESLRLFAKFKAFENIAYVYESGLSK